MTINDLQNKFRDFWQRIKKAKEPRLYRLIPILARNFG